MIRAALLGAAALAAAGPALAEGGAILGGEHVGFSRIVMEIAPGAAWSLETAPGRATVAFPGRNVDFRTTGTFEKLPKTRIQAVRAVAGAAGTAVDVDISCDCLVSALLVGTRYVALDVADPGVVPPGVEVAAQLRLTGDPPPPQESAEARVQRETAAVASAEHILIQQIERAASQGLIELSDDPAPGEEATEIAAPADPPAQPQPEPSGTPAAAPETPPTASAPPAAPLRSEPPAEAPAGLLARLLDHEQIQATTVFDRDGRRAAARLAEPALPPVCIADAELDVAAWSNGLPMHAQAVALGRRLVGEFDAPDPAALRDLVRLHIRFGFGAEAGSLLASFDTALPDQALLADLGRAVDGRPAAPGGPLARAEPCPGRHGLWLALGGVAPAFHDAAHFATVHAAFAELPPDFRALTAPALVNRLLDAGRPGEARLIYDTAARPTGAASAELTLAEARLAAAEGRPVEGARALAALVETNAPNATEALTHMVRLALDAGLPIPERVITDLRAAAVQHRNSAREAELRGLLAEALGRQGAIDLAVEEIRAARADLGEESFDALAVRVLAAADPERAGPALYAETVLAAADLIAPAPGNDGARTAIAGHLLDLGLPDPALAVVAPAAARGGAAARLLAARANLRLGETEAAVAALGALQGREAAELRAEAFALNGSFALASSELDAGGLPPGAAPYAWPAGDWPRARATSDDPARVAMAGYMAARENGAEAPAPAADPAALDPPAAFQEPLPPLADPSLDAARRLLAAGRQVEGFVQDLLAEDGGSGAAQD
jgi:hypothetical protein